MAARKTTLAQIVRSGVDVKTLESCLRHNQAVATKLVTAVQTEAHAFKNYVRKMNDSNLDFARWIGKICSEAYIDYPRWIRERQD
jgi:hypothetical protein